MRILLTSDPEIEVPPKFYGGIQRIVDSLVTGLQKRGHHVGLVARPGSTCPADAFFPWAGLESQNKKDTVRNILVLRSAVKSFKPDVIHSYSRLVYLMPFLRSSVKKIMCYQREPGARQIRLASQLGGKNLLFSGCSDHICESGRVGGGTWKTVYNFVDSSDYDFVEEVPADAPLVFLSRIERLKGTHTAIEVAKKSNRRLLIAGNYYEDGEAGAYWRDEIKPLLGKDGIEYVGTVDDKQKNELLGSAAAMIVPIEWEEPFGIVFAESLACGTPVISSPRGSVPEIVLDKTHGFHMSTVEEGVAAVRALPEISRAKCRARAEEIFCLDAILDQYEKLYSSPWNGNLG